MSMSRIVYLVDVGMLLTSENEDFESYNMVYDHKYGYYDENQLYMLNKDKAIDFINKYVSEGVDMTYGVVLQTELSYDVTDEEIEGEEVTVEGEYYGVDAIVYSTAKINGKIVENFIKV